MRATLKDVAKLVGVNFTLVSKYLNHNPQARMSAETRERIDRAIKELDYHPSAIARSLRNGRSHTVGMVSGNLTNAYNAHVVNLALNIFNHRGYQLLIALCDGDDIGGALDSLARREVDAIFAPGYRLPTQVVCPCLLQLGAAPEPAPLTAKLEVDSSLDAALKALPGRVTGLFFQPAGWSGAFLAAAARAGRECVCRELHLERSLRRDEIRAVCQDRPDSILSSGWETLQMLLELLEDEFPDYHPSLLLHANCTGPFLDAPGIVGVIHSSTTRLVESCCAGLIDRIESPGDAVEPLAVATRFIPHNASEYRRLVTRRFELT